MRYRIDVDAGDEDRPDIYNYIIDRFGTDKTARVLALGTTSEKSTIENICRAFEVPLDKVDEIKKEWDANPDKCRKDYPKIFYYFDGILGSYTSQSIHVAGIVASPITLYDNYGVFWDSDGLQIICLDMDCVHDVGLVKYDILPIRQISIIKTACKYIGILYPKSYQINWNDPKVWEDMKKSQIAIFQFEEDYSFKSLCDYGTNSIDDMTVVTAAIRPSGASYREDLFAHKPHKNPSELIDNLLSDTNGYLCVEGNQLVNTKLGLKPIKDVVVGDYVLTRSGWREVTRSQKTGTKKTVKIMFGGRSIQLTPNHQILTDYGWKEAGLLQPGDCVLYRDEYDSGVKVCENSTRWVKVQSVEDADVVDVYDITVDGEHEFTCQGIIVHNCYQEQILSFLQQVCGLSGSEADDVRRGIARKKVDVLQSHMQQILDGYCEKSDKPREVAEQEAQEFLQIIEDASSYMFGKVFASVLANSVN